MPTQMNNFKLKWIIIFAQDKYMLSLVQHKKSFITSRPACTCKSMSVYEIQYGNEGDDTQAQIIKIF